MHTYAESIANIFPHPGPLVPLPLQLFPQVRRILTAQSALKVRFPPSLCVLNGKLICLEITPHGSFKSLDPTPPFHLNVSGIHCKSPWSLLIHLSSLPAATLPGPYLFPPPCRGPVFGFVSCLMSLSSC